MNTISLTKKQKKVVDEVRALLHTKGMQIENDDLIEDELNEGKAIARIYTTDRDSAGDDDPPAALVEQFNAYAREFRAISPLVFALVGKVDEWITLTLKVRVTPRHTRPIFMENLSSLVALRLPAKVIADKRVTYSSAERHVSHDGCIAVKTNMKGRYDLYWLRLTWDILGNSVEGFILRVQWGEHSIERPANIKKVTPTTILKQFNLLLGQLVDPLDGGDWVYTVKDPSGNYRLDRRGDYMTHYQYQVTNDHRRAPMRVRARPEYPTVVMTNLVTQACFTCVDGDTWPSRTNPLRLDEKSFLRPKGDKLYDKDAEFAGCTSDGIPIYFGYKDIEEKDYDHLMFWVTPYAGKVNKEYLRAHFIDPDLENVSNWKKALGKWEEAISRMHSSRIADLIEKFGGEMNP